jgi:endonuclease/exonuclease/phosphatase family metal-dependent hydrolase
VVAGLGAGWRVVRSDDGRQTVTADDAVSELRVWTWNALANSYEGPAGLVDDRLGEIGQEVADGADIVGFQEIQRRGADRVVEILGDRNDWSAGERDCLEVTPGGSTPGQPDSVHCVWTQKHDPLIIDPEGLAIVSRFDLVDVGSLVLSDERYGDLDSNRRVVLAATVRGQAGDVRVYTTHLATKCAERNAQAERILAMIDSDRRATERPFEAVVLGDLNTTPQTKTCSKAGTETDEALYVFATGGQAPPWIEDPCVAFCALQTIDGLAGCEVKRDDAAKVLADPDRYADCGFTLRRKEAWEADSDAPWVPYQTVDYVLIESGLTWVAYERPWFTGEWKPGDLTPAQVEFERYLALSDHVPVKTVIRLPS